MSKVSGGPAARIIRKGFSGFLGSWFANTGRAVGMFAVLTPLLTASVALGQPNYLVVIADDLGHEHIALHGVSEAPVAVPAVDRLAGEGLVLRNLWTAPICSPSRALLMTGRHAHKTGVGANVNRETDAPLPLAERTLPEVLGDAGYATALFGKWHLGFQDEVGGRSAPLLQGFDHFRGHILMDNLVEPHLLHERWWESEDGGEPVLMTGFLDEAMFGYAADWIAEQTGPWLAVVAGYLPHWPYVCPPAELRPTEPCGDDEQNYRAMIEAHDVLLGRLLDAVPPDVVVIWLSDNGSPRRLERSPVPPARAKTTVWQGGVVVPAIIRSPDVGVGVLDAPVSSSSLLATLAEWSNIPVPDNVEPSIASCLAGGACPEIVAVETWSPNRSPWVPSFGELAVRNDRYKMRATTHSRIWMFDLLLDPYELDPLHRSASPGDWDTLGAALVEIRNGWEW